MFTVKKIFVLVCLLGLLNLFLIYKSWFDFGETEYETKFPSWFPERRYLIETEKCKILDFQPLEDHKRVKPKSCGPSDLLTYVTVDNNTATLHINEKLAKKYRNFDCFYRDIGNFDVPLKLPAFTPFKSRVKIDFDYVFVKCLRRKRVFYSNTHAPIILKEDIIKRQKLMKNPSEAFSVLIIGIDNMSRLNFLQFLPETRLLLKENNWISLKGYNKVAGDTHPNLMALLAGLDNPKVEEKCRRSLISCPLVLFDYQNHGYATAYARDEPRMDNYPNPPIDYHFWPYFRVNEKLKTRKIDNFCTGPESSSERVLNLAKNFAKTLQNRPSFGVFWMNGFTKNNLNLDSKIRDFFVNISHSGILKNTFVFFLSDYGFHVGPFRHTHMSWLEERLPFNYIWVPVKFRIKFRRQYHNLEFNIDQLTSPYHLYMTLQDILVLSKQGYEIKPSQGCSKCQSLFENFEDRSCQDAGIEAKWCTCNTYTAIPREANLVVIASEYVLRYIHTIIFDHNGEKNCLRYTIAKIISAGISDDHRHILLILETNPKAVFETTVLYQPGSKQTFSVKGEISRLDRYAKHSYCTSNRLLRKLCYCR
ncbi:uncharacterized protein LOC123010049 [Tribolium madens]|uniref:uncharacterized protein LOC123010049 n=1 Tax=Tribolium madens TaxID=41895 RepID=UPI001CF7386B|nr:uncharacterized protein LOC123010049 [Tribolium madens]